MSDIIPLIETRTAAGVDDDCGMRYWWNFEESGTGIVPVEESKYLTVGKEIHEDLAHVANLPDGDLTPAGVTPLVASILQELHPDEHEIARKEHIYRRAGWAAAFALYLEPRIRKEFETVQVEHDIVLDRGALWVPITPDRVLRHREGGYLVYKEWKSTITASAKWLASWPYAIQLHAGMAAIEEELDEKVAYSQIIGLLKGDQRGDRLTHPYVWAWKSTKTGAWTHDYAKARSAEWEHAPIWEFPGGVVEWVVACGPDVAAAQFPHSAPVTLNRRMLDDWIDRRLYRQEVIEEVRTECQHDWKKRILYFEPRTSKCRPGFGDICPYLRCCWSAEVNENPLAGGLFVRRTPHHELEAIGVE